MVKTLKYHLNRHVLDIRTYFRYVLVIVFVIAFFDAQGQKKSTSSLPKFLRKLEATYKVQFSYDATLAKQTEVNQINFEFKSLQQDLVHLLRFSGLGFDIIDDNQVLLKQVEPDFYHTYSRKICGAVFDASSGLPLDNASVNIVGTSIGVTTDSLGRFYLSKPIFDSDHIRFSYLGYFSKSLPASHFLNKPCKMLSLDVKKNEITTVIVRDDYNSLAGIRSVHSRPDEIIIQPEKINGVGGIVKNDVFVALQSLPGVSTHNESSTKLHVRGGTASQNLILYDNIPMYHYGHLFGKISTFNNDLVENVRFYKSGSSSKDGGMVSGVVNVQTRSEIPKELSVKANADFLSFGGTAEIPLMPNKAGIVIGYRKSLSGNGVYQSLFDHHFQQSKVTTIQEIIDTSTLPNVGALHPSSSFNDLSLKALWQPVGNDLLQVTLLSVQDNLQYHFDECTHSDCYGTRDSMEVSNLGIAASYKHFWKPNFSSSINTTYSSYNKRYQYINDKSMLDATTVQLNKNEIKDLSVQLNNEWYRHDIMLRWGLQAKSVTAELDNELTALSGNDTLFDSDMGLIRSAFVDYTQEVDSRFHLFLGTRLSQYNLADNALFFEPRFSVWTQPLPKLKFKFGGGIYHQFLSQIVESVSLYDQDESWVLSNRIAGVSDYHEIEKSKQLNFGIQYEIQGWDLNVDVFDKTVDGISSRAVDFGVLDVNFEGSLTAKGFEAGVSKWTDRYFTQVSYTLSDVLYSLEWPDYDIPPAYYEKHHFSLLQGFHYKDFTVAINWKLKSGKPYSPFGEIQVDTTSGYQYWIEYEPYNSGRLSPYNRFDFSLNYKKNWPWLEGDFTLSFLNLFNRANIQSRSYTLQMTDEAILGLELPKVVTRERYGLPFLPNLTVSLKFLPGKWKKWQQSL